MEEEVELRERGVERSVASEGRKHGVTEAKRGGVGFRKRGDERGGDGGALEGVAGSGEAGEESVVVVEAKADDAGVELGEAASRAAAAEEGGDRGDGLLAAAAMGEGDARSVQVAAKRARMAWWLWRPRRTIRDWTCATQQAVRQRPRRVATVGDGRPAAGVMRLRRRVGR